MATRFEDYTEAVRFLNEAADAIDQAHACMNDAGLDNIEVRTGVAQSRYTGIAALFKLVTEMEKEIQTAECDDCGHALSKHGGPYGCEHERGDVPTRGREGHCIDVAGGPCACEWGRVDPAKAHEGRAA
jgi:hypothetical protein